MELGGPTPPHFAISITPSSLFYLLLESAVEIAFNVARMEEGRSAFKILTGNPTGKMPLGRPRPSIRVTGLIRLRIGIIEEPL